MTIVVLGTAGHARSCIDALASRSMDVVGCVGEPPRGELSTDYLGADDVLPSLARRGVQDAIVAVGDNRLRQRLTSQVVALGFSLPVVIAPTAWVATTAKLGAGTVILQQTVVGPFAQLGAGVILNTCASVDHDGRIGDFVHIAPGTHLAGDVTVGDGAFLGVGVSALPASTIGAWATVGAGATVVADVMGGVTAIGTPAREITIR